MSNLSYRCTSCGYGYIPQEHNGLSLDSQNNGWECPDCQAPIDQFTKIYGKGTLENAGKISHSEAMDKADEEYKKYQAKTLSPVEKDYLDAIMALEQKVAKKGTKHE